MSFVKSYSVGNGDMFCISHNTDNFTIIDCCYESDEEKERIINEIKQLSKGKGIVRFISTHPDEDHIKGLPYLDEQIGILNFYCVKNKAIKTTETENFVRYCQLRDDSKKSYYVYAGCHRRWMNQSNDERKGAGINFHWPDVNDTDFKYALSQANQGIGYNNISPIFTYSVSDGASFLWMGDMETDMQEKIKAKVTWPQIDVLFAPHHGRDSAKIPEDILKKLNPQVIIIGEAESSSLNYYSGYNTIKQNSAGNITFVCTGTKIHIYIQKEGYKKKYPIEILIDEGIADNEHGKYFGTIVCREI